MLMIPLDVIPSELRTRSLSQSEIVLQLADALDAIGVLERSGWGMLGWEGWVQYPNGIGHHQDYQGTVTLEQSLTQTWQEFVRWSANVCRESMQRDQARFSLDPNCQDLKLYFCLSPIQRALESTAE